MRRRPEGAGLRATGAESRQSGRHATAHHFGIGKSPLAAEYLRARTIQAHQVAPATADLHPVDAVGVVVTEAHRDRIVAIALRVQAVDGASGLPITEALSVGVIHAHR